MKFEVGKKYKLKKMPMKLWIEIGKNSKMGMEKELYEFSGKEAELVELIDWNGCARLRFPDGQKFYFAEELIDVEKFKVIEYVLKGEEK